MRSTGLTKKKFNQIGLKIMKGTYNSLKKICISKWSVGRFWRYHLACTAHSAHFGGFFCLCTTGPSKAPNRSFWNRYFFEAYICTFHNLKSNLVELFFVKPMLRIICVELFHMIPAALLHNLLKKYFFMHLLLFCVKE